MSKKFKSYPKLNKYEQNLVKEHSYLTESLAYRALTRTRGYTGCLTFEDLKGVASFALCVAATRYDSNNKAGASFKTYAWRTIDGYIRHALRDKSRMIRFPRWVPQMRDKVKNLTEEGFNYEEISEILGIDMEEIEMCERSWREIYYPIDDNNEDWIYYRFEEKDELQKYLQSLSYEEIEELTLKAEKGDLNDERIQIIKELVG